MHACGVWPLKSQVSTAVLFVIGMQPFQPHCCSCCLGGVVVQASYPPVPSLERLKPFEGGDDDDDGLDKDLWMVVEKGSLCASADCVYRDAVSMLLCYLSIIVIL